MAIGNVMMMFVLRWQRWPELLSSLRVVHVKMAGRSYPRFQLSVAMRASNCRGWARLRGGTRSDFPLLTYLLLLLHLPWGCPCSASFVPLESACLPSARCKISSSTDAHQTETAQLNWERWSIAWMLSISALWSMEFCPASWQSWLASVFWGTSYEMNSAIWHAGCIPLKLVGNIDLRPLLAVFQLYCIRDTCFKVSRRSVRHTLICLLLFIPSRSRRHKAKSEEQQHDIFESAVWYHFFHTHHRLS